MTASKQTILIIEDDKAIGGAYDLVFKAEGFNVILKENALDGIAAAVSDKPDVILLDIMLPDLTGWEVLTKLKEDEATKTIPVIIDSNLYSAERERGFLDAGAAKYVVKSDLEPADIVKIVREVLA